MAIAPMITNLAPVASVSALAGVFPRYGGYDPLVPVYCVSHPERPTTHRFYDSSPISPSGRYIAVTELPYEDRLPTPGDTAEVCVVDLHSGKEAYRTTTRAWDTQVGAHAQWGPTDEMLFFNRMDEGGTPYGVRVNLLSGAETRLGGTVYMCSPDGAISLSPSLSKISIVQRGYGINLANYASLGNVGISPEDGVFRTDNITGDSSLLLSFAAIVSALPAEFSDLDPRSGALYGFHVKWNPQGTRVMFILRWLPHKGGSRTRNYLVTFRPDGSDIRLALHWRQWRSGHHPNWCPDGEHIIMNLLPRDLESRHPSIGFLAEKVAHRLGWRVHTSASALRLVTFRYDGTGYSTRCPVHCGSGHPTVHRDGVHIMTDAYPSERVAFADGSVPLRWLNMETGESRTLVRICTTPRFSGPRQELRIDPHPAWHPSGELLAFNGCPDGVRQVFVADLSDLVRA